ncbi:uncharacterized protein LOC134947608 [Pseudophryne corroboree]|uniref:uncharacterized protein LOC134947608 n=1 Tax=Pseudophryne corroboree TaxID=495146 RepID=UPI003081444B
MNSGGVCVIPADTGYVIASACHSPDSVQKVSQINLESAEKEISIFITSLNQLQPVKYLLSKEIWAFIEGLWPNPVGFVLPEIGDWLKGFGLASVSSLLDSSKSVILYISDCGVTGQIIDRVGPIAVRLLTKGTQNLPSQMFAKLLTQVDGVLLDTAHDTEYEFTVVDCTKMEMGVIDVLKVGAVPTIKVLDVLHTVITREDSCSNTVNSIYL